MVRVALAVGLAVFGQLVAGTCVMESARRIPLAKETDVLVVGGSSAAVAPAIAAALAKPGVSGWARPGASAVTPSGGFCSSPKNGRCLRELNLARALHACGDHEGVARKILEAYAADLRGVFALHARAVLDARDGAR